MFISRKAEMQGTGKKHPHSDNDQKYHAYGKHKGIAQPCLNDPAMDQMPCASGYATRWAWNMRQPLEETEFYRPVLANA